MANLILGYYSNPLQGTGTVPGTTGELLPLMDQLVAPKLLVMLAVNSRNKAISDYATEIYTRIRQKVKGRRTYTAQMVSNYLNSQFAAFCRITAFRAQLNAVEAAGRLRAKTAQFVLKAQEPITPGDEGLGYVKQMAVGSYGTPGILDLDSLSITEISDKIAEYEQMLDAMPLPKKLQDVAKRVWGFCYTTTPIKKNLMQPFVQFGNYRWLNAYTSMTEFGSMIDTMKEQWGVNAGANAADYAQLMADMLDAGISKCVPIKRSDKVEDCFKYDPTFLDLMGNSCHAQFKWLDNGTYGMVVEDYSYTHIYSADRIYVFGDVSDPIVTAGITYDDSNPDDGSEFPTSNWPIQSSALWGIQYTRLVSYSGPSAASPLDCCTVSSSVNAYVDTDVNTETGVRNINVAFRELALARTSDLHGFFPTLSVREDDDLFVNRLGYKEYRGGFSGEVMTNDEVKSIQYKRVGELLDELLK